jgi:hypothetical protein
LWVYIFFQKECLWVYISGKRCGENCNLNLFPGSLVLPHPICHLAVLSSPVFYPILSNPILFNNIIKFKFNETWGMNYQLLRVIYVSNKGLSRDGVTTKLQLVVPLKAHVIIPRYNQNIVAWHDRNIMHTLIKRHLT